jgi:hypothetical protein
MSNKPQKICSKADKAPMTPSAPKRVYEGPSQPASQRSQWQGMKDERADY